jgi:signal transduction histidine kinase
MIYHTINELVTNALKHANAQSIHLQVVQEMNRISINIQDDGCGFDIKQETKGNGLNNIRNSVASFNGHIEIYSTVGKGTEINVEFNLK